MYTPAYPTNLQEIFNSGNYSVLPEVMRQQATAQQQAEANVAGTQQAQDIAAQKLPYELASTQANTDLAKAHATLSGSQSKEIEDKLAALPPAAQRMALAHSDIYAKISKNDYDKLSTQYQKLGMFATAAESNGGVVPLAMQQDPDFAKFSSYMQNPGWIKAAKTAQMAHIALDPQYRSHIDAAGVQANAHLQGIREQTAAQERMNKAIIDAGKYRNHGDEFMRTRMLSTPMGAVQYWVMQKYSAFQAMQKAAAGSPEYLQAKAAYDNAIAEEAQATRVANAAGFAQAQVAAASKVAIDTLTSGNIGSVPTPQPTPPVNPAGGTPPPQPAASSPAKMDKAAIIKAYRDAGSTGTDQEILDYHNKTYGGK